MGRKALFEDAFEIKVRVERSEIEELRNYYPHYGQRGKLLRGLLRRHLKAMRNQTAEAMKEILQPEELEG